MKNDRSSLEKKKKNKKKLFFVCSCKVFARRIRRVSFCKFFAKYYCYNIMVTLLNIIKECDENVQECGCEV